MKSLLIRYSFLILHVILPIITQNCYRDMSNPFFEPLYRKKLFSIHPHNGAERLDLHGTHAAARQGLRTARAEMIPVFFNDGMLFVRRLLYHGGECRNFLLHAGEYP